MEGGGWVGILARFKVTKGRPAGVHGDRAVTQPTYAPPNGTRTKPCDGLGLGDGILRTPSRGLWVSQASPKTLAKPG